MNGKELMESLSFVDDELLEEASDPRRTVVPRKKLLAAAACLVLMLGAAAMVLPGTPISGDGNTEGVGGAQTEAAATEAASVHGSTLVVRVEAFSEEGFTASVVEDEENAGFSAGELLEIRFEGPTESTSELDCENAKREELWYRVTVDRIEDGIVYVTEAVELPESERRN